MDQNDFDEIAEKYNTILGEQLKFFDEDDSYFAEYKIIKLKNLLKFEPKSILDFGCGIGRSTLFLQRYFPKASIYGSDTSQKSLIKAKKLLPSVEFFLIDELVNKTNVFDVIFISNVFHHIEPDKRLKTMELISVASKAGALMVVFEHNPYNPVTRYLVNTCPFDHDAVLLKPQELKTLFRKVGIKNIGVKYTLFFPGFLKYLRFLEPYLGFLPLGGQYVVSGNL